MDEKDVDVEPQESPAEETPSSDISTPLAYTLVRIIGVIAAIHSTIGLVFGLGSLFLLPGNFDPEMFESPEVQQQIEEALQAMPEEERPDSRDLDFSQMADMMNSPEFLQFFYALTIVGIIFNILLAYIGNRLFQYQFSSIGHFVYLMLAFALYLFLLPIIINSMLDPDTALKFSGAWSIGNFGQIVMLATYFWFWGPLVALYASRNAPKPA